MVLDKKHYFNSTICQIGPFVCYLQPKGLIWWVGRKQTRFPRGSNVKYIHFIIFWRIWLFYTVDMGLYFPLFILCPRFYIGCDMCANWFHGACVQVSPEAARSMDEWTCAECTQARRGVEEEELYCLCRQPYDDSKYVLCGVYIMKCILGVFLKSCMLWQKPSGLRFANTNP